MNALNSPSSNMDFSLFTTLTEKPGVTGSYGEHYADLLDMFELADTLGYDAAFVAEHHTAGNPDRGYPLVPNPAVMLAALAMRTRNIKLGPCVAVLPFRNPLQIVEDYAMLDQLSGGRLIMGVGSGDPNLTHEIEGYCISPEERLPRYMESLKVIEAAWQGIPVTYDGTFNRFNKASLNIRLKQDPPPPIHVAISRPDAAYALASHGYPIYAVPYAGVSNVIRRYREGREAAGLPYAPDQHYIMFNSFVANSATEVRAKFAEAAARAGNDYDWNKFDEMISAGNWLVGSVDEVVTRLEQLHGQGLRKVMLAMDFVVGMPMPHVLEALNLFVKEVVPRLEDRLSWKRDAERALTTVIPAIGTDDRVPSVQPLT